MSEDPEFEVVEDQRNEGHCGVEDFHQPHRWGDDDEHACMGTYLKRKRR